MVDETSSGSPPPNGPTTNSNFLDNILTPGSSLDPTFLLILDGAFGTLLCVFLGLLYLTGGNIHIFALIGIEGCLWASVKWYIHELQKPPPPTGGTLGDVKLKDE
ncbi:hypothetical protein BC835DRAFT_1412918 [Cytidiella melzeri]|nr:hypothetical protein BC835DRAFT_1412918 [Cytidiella melzeri]